MRRSRLWLCGVGPSLSGAPLESLELACQTKPRAERLHESGARAQSRPRERESKLVPSSSLCLLKNQDRRQRESLFILGSDISSREGAAKEPTHTERPTCVLEKQIVHTQPPQGVVVKRDGTNEGWQLDTALQFQYLRNLPPPSESDSGMGTGGQNFWVSLSPFAVTTSFFFLADGGGVRPILPWDSQRSPAARGTLTGLCPMEEEKQMDQSGRKIVAERGGKRVNPKSERGKRRRRRGSKKCVCGHLSLDVRVVRMCVIAAEGRIASVSKR